MRAKWVFILVIGIIAVIAIALFLIYPRPPAGHSVAIPWVIQGPASRIPQVNLPINRSVVTQYATSVINNYNNLVDSKEANYPNFPSIQHFFPLYHPVGSSFEVLVARDNVKADDWIEFFFVPSPAASPQIVVYTNVTAEYLRPVVGSYNQRSNFTFDDRHTPYGIIVSHVTTESPYGVNYFPLIWITNSSTVYGNIAANSKNAAQAIYQGNVDDMNESLNPPFPSWGWLWNSLSSVVGRILEGAAALARIFYLYEFTTGRIKWPRKQPTHVRNPRESKAVPQENGKGKGTECNDEKER